MPVLIKITYCRDGQSIWLDGHFEKRPRLADREKDLFGGTEFIVPDVLFNTTNVGAPKKRRDYPDVCPSGGVAAALPSNFIVKLINKTKFYTEKALFWCKCTLSSASNSVRQM